MVKFKITARRKIKGEWTRVGYKKSFAAINLIGRFLLCGESSNPEFETRNAVVNVMDGETGKIIGKILKYSI